MLMELAHHPANARVRKGLNYKVLTYLRIFNLWSRFGVIALR
jgi:hypothetical protein